MTTTADKIRALPIYDYLSAEAAYGFACAREAAAALVEAEPQAVRVKPLVWSQFREGGCVGRTKEFQYFVTQQHNGRFFCHFDESSHDHLADAQAHCDQHYQRAALDLTPTPVDASPAPDPVRKIELTNDERLEYQQALIWCSAAADFAPEGQAREGWPKLCKPLIDRQPVDPVSPTPTLDAMAMREAAAALAWSEDEERQWEYWGVHQNMVTEQTVSKEIAAAIRSITLPADAALAEAMRLPEVKALVEAAEAVIRDFHGDNAIGVAHLTKLRAALKGVK